NSLAGGELIVDPTESQITIEKARDVEVDFVNGAIYVLDGDGDMLFLGNANVNLRPSPMGLDWYRDMELGPNGRQMYFLTGNGILSAVGDASVPSWSNLVEEDLYRDIELRVRGGAVTNVVLTDANGNIQVFGSGGGIGQTLGSLTPQSEINPGTVRQVKLFPNTDDLLMLIEGSGHPIFLTQGQEINPPSDRLIFSDEPGLDDDRIVDVETTSINLQSAVEGVREIISAFAEENISRIMSLVSPNYKDKTGADAAGLERSLSSFFRFYEVQDYAQNKLAENSFTITNQGDTIVAQVVIDISLFYPQIFYYMPDVDTSSIVGETFGEQLFVDPQITFDQTITIREVSDGRGWIVDLYEIRNYGRYLSEYIDQEEFEYEDYSVLLKMTQNRRLPSYCPRKVGIDDPIQIFLDINEENILEPFNILAIFREPYLTRNYMPPVFEYTVYSGSIIYMTEFDTVEFEFSRESDGSLRLTSMDMRIPISLNESQFLEVDAAGGTTENVLSQLDDLEVENISGFSFSQRGPVAAIFQGEADITMPDTETLQASYPLGGIMMLPENTNIYSINPLRYLETNITRSIVKANPYDPNQDALLDSIPGMTASYVAGRAYFVITADGKHFGFLQIPEDALLDLDVDTPLIPFDFRYEDSFVLPDDF
ncbi:MAG: hypothetical protein ACP5I1_00875, partial [Candidatus Hinthialibacter sp.]